ncbi:MAG: hypothetical protein NWE93_07720 [Candidatus Bathyarchaeota archaeon]|nr:hypothetical protein [Candidatus Bathyarchaeota archaeon]
MSTIALLDGLQNKKQIEVAFIAVFSVLIFAIFYVLVSMNGVVLGNDPAVHLEKAQIFLNTGQISLANIGWTPPLYQIVLAMLISLSGASAVAQYIVLVRVFAVVVDWLLFMAVYLMATKFFGRKVGVVASVLLLMSFPTFEMNAFGGYTTVLALAFLFLVLLYTPLAVNKLGYLAVAFFAAFGLVLSHQLAAFLAVFIMPPVLLYMLIKSKGKNLKVVMALALGGGIAFFLYYFQAMAGYLDVVIDYVFFAIKAYAYQIPYTSFGAFMIDYGFVFFFAVAGIGISYYLLRKRGKPLYFLILILSFAVPLFFAESYLFGLFMPFQWFMYYVTPPIAILAAVAIVFCAEKLLVYYSSHRLIFRKMWVRAMVVLVVVALAAMLVYRGDVVYGKIMEASVFYSTTDVKAYDAGVWLKENYPEPANVTVTRIPGFWFQEFSGKNVTAQTDHTVQRNEVAESILSLSYEIEQPQTLLKAYEAKGAIYDETYVSFDQVWNRVSYTSGAGDFVMFSLNGVDYNIALSSMHRITVFNSSANPKSISFIFTNQYVAVTKTIQVADDQYPFTVSWTLTPLQATLSNASLYLSTLMDLAFKFDRVQIPGLYDWISPWDAPSQLKTVSPDGWVAAAFAGAHLTDNYLGLYDEADDVAVAFRFNELPEWGNVGALNTSYIDAVRFGYGFGDLAANQSAGCSYEVLSLSKSTYPTLSPQAVEGLFDLKPAKFAVSARDYMDYINENDIRFIVYDKNQLDTTIIHSKLLQQIFSNDRYVIFKILR